MLEHMLRLGKIEVLSARARCRAPNARELLIIGYTEYLIKCSNKPLRIEYIFPIRTTLVNTFIYIVKFL